MKDISSEPKEGFRAYQIVVPGCTIDINNEGTKLI